MQRDVPREDREEPNHIIPCDVESQTASSTPTARIAASITPAASEPQTVHAPRAVKRTVKRWRYGRHAFAVFVCGFLATLYVVRYRPQPPEPTVGVGGPIPQFVASDFAEDRLVPHYDEARGDSLQVLMQKSPRVKKTAKPRTACPKKCKGDSQSGSCHTDTAYVATYISVRWVHAWFQWERSSSL